MPQLLLGKDSGKVTGGEQSEYMLHTLFHGDDLTLGQSEPERKTLVDWEPASQEPEFFREICDLPPQETWKNARDYGAYGNGISDDIQVVRIVQFFRIYVNRVSHDDTVQYP